MSRPTKALVDWYHWALTSDGFKDVSASIHERPSTVEVNLDCENYRSAICVWDHNAAMEILALSARTGAQVMLYESEQMSEAEIIAKCNAYLSDLRNGSVGDVR